MTPFRSTMHRLALALAAAAAFPPALRAQDGAKPVVAVLYFDNNSLGKDRADFDGLGKGIADLLITDLAANPSVRVVERDRVQKLLEEQDLAKAGRIDNATAVQLGKILQAQYMILGGFMNDGRGNNVLTARAVVVQTTQVVNPLRVQSKDDDVLALVGQLSAQLARNLKLPAVPRVGEATVTPAGEPAAPSTPAPARPAPAKRVAQAPAPASRRMDTRTALLYAKALDEADRGNRNRAIELFSVVLDQMPGYAPAEQHVAKLKSR